MHVVEDDGDGGRGWCLTEEEPSRDKSSRDAPRYVGAHGWESNDGAPVFSCTCTVLLLLHSMRTTNAAAKNTGHMETSIKYQHGGEQVVG